MFILKTGHQPGVYVPLRALFLVSSIYMYAQGKKIMKQSYSYFPTHIVANERFIKRHSAPPNNVQI